MGIEPIEEQFFAKSVAKEMPGADAAQGNHDENFLPLSTGNMEIETIADVFSKF